MNCLFNINVCRVCMQNDQSCDVWNDKVLLEKFEFTTHLRIANDDNLPKAICARCASRLKVAYTFVKTAHDSEKNLKQFLEKISFEFKEVTLGKKSNGKLLNEKNDAEDEFFSLMDEEYHENSDVYDKNRYSDDTRKSKSSPDDCKNDNSYNLSKDILLIHDNNEIDSDCENNSHFIEIPGQNGECKDHYNEEDPVPENNHICPNSMIMVDSNEESKIRCQTVNYAAIEESEGNHEYDSVINCQDDIQSQSIYIEESSIDDQKHSHDSAIDNLNNEIEMHENTLKRETDIEHRQQTSTKIAFRKQCIAHRFYCDKCNRDFSTKTNLNRHMQSHEGNRPFSCTECKKSFTQKSTLKQHMYTHTGERPYVCEVCNRGFTQCKSLIFHMRRHTGEKPFHCEYCLITFRQKDALRIHILKHHVVIEHTMDGKEIFSCIICQRKFETKYEFRTHMKAHTTSGEVDNDIELFRSEEKLLTNITKKTNGVLTATDTGCFNAAIVNISSSSAAEPSRAKKFQCRNCFKCFALKKSLVRHMRIHYAESDDYLTECFDCDLQFFSKDEYQEHLSECHQHTCSACPEVAFTTVQELKMHMFEHGQE